VKVAALAQALALLLGPLAPTVDADIDRSTIVVFANEADRTSLEAAEYYASARRIPDDRVVRIRLPNEPSLSREEFAYVRADVLARMPRDAEAIAAVWRQPYRVDCMSITSALAFGFDERHCARPCARTLPSTLYDADTRSPRESFGILPSMLVTGSSLTATRTLIDRAVAAEPGAQRADAYLVTSGDPNRDIRGYAFRRLLDSPPPGVRVLPRSRFLLDESDIMFYFTGAVRVPGLSGLRFEPGAVADHVTSAGAIFEQSTQMTVLEWLDAGVTGSYGTVVEPCAFPEKFPNPDILVRRYTAGETLVEAYWKSVRMPGQGLFVGDPLTRPFRRN
jgi:uncharacterized protein (TIGR03790 family)